MAPPQQNLQLPPGPGPRPPPAPRLFSRLSHVSKRSFLSHSSSFEADDERSSTNVSIDYQYPDYQSVNTFTGAAGGDRDRMSSTRRRGSEDEADDDDDHGNFSEQSSILGGIENGGHGGRGGHGGDSARYPGDDTRPTSPKELAGWYAYAFAAEVYVICGQYLLLSILSFRYYHSEL